jgi:uncharacterized membrane protein
VGAERLRRSVVVRTLSSILRTLTMALTVTAAVYAYRTKQPEGRILNVPYDFRMPTMERLRRRVWNPDEPRVFTPTIFGVGWSLNLFQVVRQLRGDTPPEDPPPEDPQPDDGVV